MKIDTDTTTNNKNNAYKFTIPSSYSSNDIVNNKYGVKVDDAILFRKLLQNKYREDLDNIIRQKKNDSQNLHNQDIDEISRIQKMNDKYNLEKITQQSIYKEYDAFNEKEAEEKKQKMKELREKQYKEYLEKLNSINLENEITKKINQEKKKNLYFQLEKDLMEYRQKKIKERQKEKKESEEYIHNKINNDIFLDSEKKYRSMISKMNNNIYKNALRYNDYLTEGKNNNVYNIKDDLSFNQKLAELKETEKKEKKMQSMNSIRLQKQKNNLQNMYEQELKEQRLLDQKNYREFLNKQKIEQKNNNNNNVLINSGEQLLMPSYRYSNVPKSLINYTLNKNNNVVNTLRNEDSPKKFYLGDSSLNHNPITCPVEDISSKKYILNQLYKQNKVNNKTPTRKIFDSRFNFLSTDFGHKISLNDISSS